MNQKLRDGGGRLLTAALRLAARGWFVFPLHVRDKRPVPGFTKWEQRASRDPQQLTAWWASAPYNIGVATGPSGLVVIDCDTPNAESPPVPYPDARCGLDVLKFLAKQAGEDLPTTFTVTTPRGGTHLYFAAPGGERLGNTAGKLGWHIDTRGVGGYVVAPGSVRPDGYYRITNRTAVASLPTWVLDLLTPTPQPSGFLPQLTGGRTNRYLQSILDGETERIVTAEPGTRNNALNIAAFVLGQLVGGGELSEEVALEVLSSAAQGHIGVAGFTEREVERTITSGMQAGKSRPRKLSAEASLAPESTRQFPLPEAISAGQSRAAPPASPVRS